MHHHYYTSVITNTNTMTTTISSAMLLLAAVAALLAPGAQAQAAVPDSTAEGAEKYLYVLYYEDDGCMTTPVSMIGFTGDDGAYFS